MNMRLDGDGNPVKTGEQVQLGGNESYVSVCMKHFIEELGCIEEFTKIGSLTDVYN